MIASRRICYGAERTTIGPAAIAKDSAVYTRVDAPTEKKKLPVHYAETRLSEASTRATAGAKVAGENVATADTTKISRSKGSVAADVLEAVSPQANAA